MSCHEHIRFHAGSNEKHGRLCGRNAGRMWDARMVTVDMRSSDIVKGNNKKKICVLDRRGVLARLHSSTRPSTLKRSFVSHPPPQL